MSELRHRTLRTNGIAMHVAEAGPEDGVLVILCHGFPELWYSWRHQLPALAGAGYHAIAPDQRGYGSTDAPGGVEQYEIGTLVDDLTGLLDGLRHERAVFVGHDWGALVVWQLAVAAPERVAAVVGMSVPFLPRPPAPPTQLMRARMGDRFSYILYFQQPGPADVELARDPRRTMGMVLWSASGDAPPGSIRRRPREGTGFLDQLSDPPQDLPAWLRSEDIDVYADAFARTGFTGPLNWYRNLDRNWERSEPYADAKVTAPALFIAGERDTVLGMTPPEVMDGWLTDLRGTVLITGAGHWVQQERPLDVNRVLLGFLRTLGGERGVGTIPGGRNA